jgi:hypothetical protein
MKSVIGALPFSHLGEQRIAAMDMLPRVSMAPRLQSEWKLKE